MEINKCPQCGAPAESSDTKCGYCKATFFIHQHNDKKDGDKVEPTDINAVVDREEEIERERIRRKEAKEAEAEDKRRKAEAEAEDKRRKAEGKRKKAEAEDKRRKAEYKRKKAEEEAEEEAEYRKRLAEEKMLAEAKEEFWGWVGVSVIFCIGLLFYDFSWLTSVTLVTLVISPLLYLAKRRKSEAKAEKKRLAEAKKEFWGCMSVWVIFCIGLLFYDFSWLTSVTLVTLVISPLLYLAIRFFKDKNL